MRIIISFHHNEKIYYTYILIVVALLVLLQCHGNGDHITQVTIRQPKLHHPMTIAEVQFFLKGQRLSPSIFTFTASSYMRSIQLGRYISGPPAAANDDNVNTFFHSAYDDKAGGYEGTCCPDPSPTLIITTHQNITFDRITIINRQDFDDSDKNFYDRLVGATITVHDRDNRVVVNSTVTAALSSYTFYPSTEYADSWSPNKVDESCPRFVLADMGTAFLCSILQLQSALYCWNSILYSVYFRVFRRKCRCRRSSGEIHL